MIALTQATSAGEISAVRDLFQNYAAWLRVDLGFQGFAAELTALPGAHAPPGGRLFLVLAESVPAACGALRPVDEGVCEMKRLFVRPEHQGKGLGRMLARRLIAEARSIGYSTMLLDTLPQMHRAIRLYESLGFARRPPYYQTPIEGTIFLELNLARVEALQTNVPGQPPVSPAPPGGVSH